MEISLRARPVIALTGALALLATAVAVALPVLDQRSTAPPAAAAGQATRAEPPPLAEEDVPPAYREAAVRPARAAPAGPSKAELAAQAEAVATGRRVEVVAKRSETGEHFAEPDGTFTAKLHPGAVRARRDGAWVPIDTTLERRADGTVGPRAAAVSLAFSGGGTGPLVRLGHEGDRVALTWPGRLPAPRLKGETATYPDVLPGVDLKLTAGAQNYRKVLVVRTRVAARDPALARLRLGLRAAGLSARLGEHGEVELAAADGRVAFSAAAPAMWDAAGHQAVGRYEVTRDSITIVPDRGLLTDPATVFPVSIDPDFPAPWAGWAKVLSGNADTPYWNGGGDVEDDGRNLAKVGRCWTPGGRCNGIGTARSYFQFDIRALHGARIIQNQDTSGAEFNAHEIYAPSCGAPPGRNYALDLHWSDPFDGRLTWNNRPWLSDYSLGTRWEMHGYDGGCPPANIGWGVGNQVVHANDREFPIITFALLANNEAEEYGWKKFDNFFLLVHYNWPPFAPSDLSASTGTNTIPCTAASDPRFVSNAAGPLTLRATGTDRDAGQPMWTTIEWGDRGSDSRTGWQTQGPVANGSRFSAVIPTGTFADGHQLWWRAQSGDGLHNGPLSTSCFLTVDNTRPGPPSLTPPQPADPPPGVGEVQTFTVAANDPDVAAFRYGLTRGGTQCSTTVSVNAGSLGGGATVRVTPLQATTWDLWVTTVDRAGNVSTGCAHHRFQVLPGRNPVARWPLDGRIGRTDVPDVAGAEHHGTMTQGPTQWTFGRVGDALQLNGTSGAFVAPSGASIRTDRGFSVAAWVKLDRTDGAWHTAVSQSGAPAGQGNGQIAGYSLQYNPGTRRWNFMLPASHAQGATRDVAASATPAVAGRWTHLVGVYDAAAGQVQLYVDGVPGTPAAHTTPWNATGTVQLGRAHFAQTPLDFWPGAIDEVRLYDRALSDLPHLEPGETAPRSEIDRLAGPPVEEAHYPLDEGGGTVAGDASGNYRNANLGGTATLATTGRVGGSLQLGSARGGFAATARQVVRNDGGFTMMAFARIRDPASPNFQVVLSQNGVNVSGVVIEYTPATRKWIAAVPATDTDPTNWQSVASTEVARAEWTHLAAVYDAGQQQLRLYVNGVLQGVRQVTLPGDLDFPLQIGRGQQGGQCCGFDGGIDEVRVYNGVVADREIAEASGQSAPRPRPLFAGSFQRYAAHDGRHYIGAGPAPAGYFMEGPLGLAAPDGAPNTRPLHSCRYSGGFFLSSLASCEGFERLGPAGSVYVNPPQGVPSAAVYRCMVPATGDHFASFDVNCESTPGRVIHNEGTFGYTRLVAPLTRFVEPGGGVWTGTSAGAFLPAGHTPRAVLGYASLAGGTGLSQLRLCRETGGDEFLTTGPCGGGQEIVMPIGFVWDTPPPGVTESARLLSCESDTGERFESVDRFCEGGAEVARLGYVITRL